MKRKNVNIVDVLHIGNRFYSAENVEELVDLDQRKTNALKLVFKYLDPDLDISIFKEFKPSGIVDSELNNTKECVSNV